MMVGLWTYQLWHEDPFLQFVHAFWPLRPEGFTVLLMEKNESGIEGGGGRERLSREDV